jgi:3-isopropylmalate dehydrogenase
MMLRHSLALPEAAEAIERAVDRVLDAGLRTADIASAGEQAVSTAEIGAEIARVAREEASAALARA